MEAINSSPQQPPLTTKQDPTGLSNCRAAELISGIKPPRKQGGRLGTCPWLSAAKQFNVSSSIIKRRSSIRGFSSDTELVPADASAKFNGLAANNKVSVRRVYLLKYNLQLRNFLSLIANLH